MVLNEPLPVEVHDLIARRRALGLDTHDEVWNGEYHMNAAPNARHARVESQLHIALDQHVRAAGLFLVGPVNIGDDEHDFRVPDLGVLHVRTDEVWLDDAAIVIEVLSPHDESWLKFDHYGSFGVDEIFIVDPDAETVRIFARTADGFDETGQSDLLDLAASALADRIDW